MARGTRALILDKARDVFNRHRYGNVTTAMLAEEIGIASGNLWYHFKTKRDLLDAITEQFILQVDIRRAVTPDEDNVLASYAHFIGLLGGELRDYRFMYRDQADYGEHSDNLLEILPNIYEDTTRQFTEFYILMLKQGHLDIAKERIPDLVHNVILVIRYYLELAREMGVANAEGSGAVTGALLQHLTLFDEHLSPAARTFLKRAFQQESAAA